MEETQQEQFSSDLKAREDSNILRFETEESLKEFIASVNEKDLLDEAHRMYNETSYLSLLLIYNMNLAELDEIGIDTINIPVVNSYDDMLHLLLNKNGEVEVAGYTMRINGDFVFKYKNGYSENIAEFLTDYEDGHAKIEKGQTLEYNETLTVYMHNNNESIEEDIDQRGVTAYDYFTGGNFRMKSRQFNGYWGFYSSIGSSTKMQQKKRYWFFGWRYRWKTVKRYNRLEYDLQYNLIYNSFPNQVQPASGNEYCFCNIARDVYSWSAGVPAPIKFSPVAGSGQSVHWTHEFSVSPNTVHRTINY